MKNIVNLLVLGALVLHLAFAASAQPGLGLGGPGPGPGFQAMLTKFFGDLKGFTANAEVTLKGDGDNAILPMTFALLDGKVRLDLDLSQMKGAKVPPEMVAQVKQMGLEKIATIVNPQGGKMTLIYPGLKSYAEMDLSKDQAEMAQKNAKMDKAALGQETVEGHPCNKCKVTLTDETGKQQNLLVWYATDLKDFPVKLQAQDKGGELTLLYRNLKLEPPTAAAFNPPAEFTKHASVEAMMQQVMMKMMGGGGPPR